MPAISPTDLNNAKTDVDHIGTVANSTALTATDRLGRTKRTIDGVLAQMDTDALNQRTQIQNAANAVLGGIGYQPPVAYAAGLSMTVQTQTVSYAGDVYAPKVADLPFTTSGTFETAKFRLIQGLAATDLAAAGGSSLVGFIQGGTGARSRTAQDKFREWVTPLDFGGIGDGTLHPLSERYGSLAAAQIDYPSAAALTESIDCHAIKAAIAYIASRRVSLAGMVNGYSTPELEFPAGYRFVVEGAISLGTDIHIRGNKAIITSSAAYPYTQTTQLFTNVGYNCIIDGLVTFGFTDAINIVTANVDAAAIDIRNCEFHEWSGIAVNVDANSASTLLRVYDNKFYPRASTASIIDNRCDRCEFYGNWVEGPCSTFIRNRKGMHILAMLGVPTAAVAGDKWILNEGTELSVMWSRFGGEAGARTIVTQKTGSGAPNSTKLVLRDNEMWTTGFPVMVFDDIPDIVIVEDNYGLNDSRPIEFSAIIPPATRQGVGVINHWSIKRNSHNIFGGNRSNAEDLVTASKMAAIETIGASLGTETVLTTSVVRNILYTEVSYTPGGSLGAGMTNGASTDMYGAAVQTITGINGASNFNTTWNTILTGLPAGMYTLLVNFEVHSDCTVQFAMHLSKQYRYVNCAKGKYTLPLSAYFDGTNNPSAGYQFVNLPTGCMISHGGLRILSGRHDSYHRWNTIVEGSAAPTSGYWRAQDEVISTNVVTGQPEGWRCSAPGSPGTWKPKGNYA